ncbi:MAG: T9SS type A sorting domain-containing protein [Bacteroidetes bacterium]|nr:T9SS type A sorting domain-containing protein [Bacteroidota bacterium]
MNIKPAFHTLKSILLGLFFFFCSASSYPADYYWVGNSGNWSDYANHWATSSGGLVFHTKVPDPFDNVFFDANSFASSAQSVNVDTTLITCNDMTWTGVLFNPSFSSSIISPILKIYGSLHIDSPMQWTLAYNSSVSFESTASGNTIFAPNMSFNSNFVFNGIAGQWSLLSDIDLTDSSYFEQHSIYFYNGSFSTNGFSIHVDGFYRSPSGGALFFDTSTIFCSYLDITGSVPIDADSSTIYGGYFDGGQNFSYNNVYSVNYLTASYCSFNRIVTDSFGYPALFIDNCTFSYAVFLDGGRINSFSSGNNYFSKAEFYSGNYNGNVSISYNNSFDTLAFYNSGWTITLEDGSVQTIYDTLIAEGTPGFPIGLESSLINNPAFINKPGGTVCLDYIYMQDIISQGGATFYAGLNSADLGGNTGWIFQSCTPPLSDVWPGDANDDGVADNYDILSIGIAFNDTGAIRQNASLNWTAQPALDWSGQFLNTANIKHADCDGNGIIGFSDTAAVSLNYGQTHAKTQFIFSALNAPELYFETSNDTFSGGSKIDVDIKLGTSINPADNIYGIAFTVHYNANAVVGDSITIDYSSSWIEQTDSLLHLEKNFSASGLLDMALARTNHLNTSGYGTIATLHILPATFNGMVTLSFSDIKLISFDETQLPVNPDSIAIFITGVFTNTSPQLQIIQRNNSIMVSAADGLIKTISLENMAGQILNYNRNIHQPVYEFDISGIPGGIYLLNIQTMSSVFTKRVIIQRGM